MWFPGVHSDVGGTFEDDPRLAYIALKWIVDGALASGIILKPHVYRKECSLSADDAVGKVHRMGWVWAVLGYRRRPVPGNAVIHESVRVRRASQPGYGQRIPGTVTWGDPGWLLPTKDLPEP